MDHVTMTILGPLLILHHDNPSAREARRRVEILLMGRIPRSGLIEVWPGARRDEVVWRRLG